MIIQHKKRFKRIEGKIAAIAPSQYSGWPLYYQSQLPQNMFWARIGKEQSGFSMESSIIFKTVTVNLSFFQT